MPDPVRGRVLTCASTGGTVLAYDETRLWQFWDYSWVCPVCWYPHCSECTYESDGETITVHDCGRFGDSHAAPGSPFAERCGCACPVIDNEYGEGFGEPRRWVINSMCRIHAKRS